MRYPLGLYGKCTKKARRCSAVALLGGGTVPWYPLDVGTSGYVDVMGRHQLCSSVCEERKRHRLARMDVLVLHHPTSSAKADECTYQRSRFRGLLEFSDDPARYAAAATAAADDHDQSPRRCCCVRRGRCFSLVAAASAAATLPLGRAATVHPARTTPSTRKRFSRSGAGPVEGCSS